MHTWQNVCIVGILRAYVATKIIIFLLTSNNSTSLINLSILKIKNKNWIQI